MRVPAPLLLPLLLLATACSDPATSEQVAGRPTIAVTLHPISSIVRTLAGDAVNVRTLLPPGAHPDTWEATPRVAEAVSAADLVVRVGGAADAWLGEVAPERELVLTEGLQLKQSAGSDHEADEDPGDHAHHHDGTGNPHVWLDPLLVRDVLLPRLADALVRTVPGDEQTIRVREAAFADSLTALHEEIHGALAGLPGRRFVSAHPAWVYFADRYGLQEVGALHPSPGSELGARELARLVDQVRHAGVRAVIAEPQLGRAGTATLADELAARVEVADPVGGLELEGREDYLSLMRYNTRAFRRALGGT